MYVWRNGERERERERERWLCGPSVKSFKVLKFTLPAFVFYSMNYGMYDVQVK